MVFARKRDRKLSRTKRELEWIGDDVGMSALCEIRGYRIWRAVDIESSQQRIVSLDLFERCNAFALWARHWQTQPRIKQIKLIIREQSW